MSDWYLGINGQQQGPYTHAQVVQMIQQGHIQHGHYAFGPGVQGWTPIASIGAFSAAFHGGNAGPPLPPPPGAAPGAAPSVADQIEYEIIGNDTQFVEIILDPGEACIAEAGSFFYMDPGIEMETIFGDGSEKDGGFFGKLKSAGKRILTGESLFTTIFGNADRARRKVAFAAPYPGKIVPLDLRQHGGSILCQKDSFLCAAKGISVGIAFNKKLGAGLFGGEGFILQKLEGQGLALVHAGGAIVERELGPGEVLRLDTGCLVAFEQRVNYDIQFVGGVKTALFGGDGLFFATLSGPGKVWLQSLPFARMADRVLQAGIKAQAGAGQGEGSILGGFGLGN